MLGSEDERLSQKGRSTANKVEEPMPEVPEKPDTTPPDKKPETTYDLTDPNQKPSYEEDEVTYVAEVVPKPESEPIITEEASNLVPESENPFLHSNIPSDGDKGEMKGEGLGDSAR